MSGARRWSAQQSGGGGGIPPFVRQYSSVRQKYVLTFLGSQLQWLVRALLLFYNVLAICSGPVQFPNGQSSGETRSLRGEPEAEPRVIHRQIKRLLLSCLLGRRRRSLQSPPQAQAEGRFFLPVIQSTNVHVNSGGGGGRPTYYPGQGGGLFSFCRNHDHD
ncbi:uncharacterized protein [Bemisia tabaci]|uniref:uncharacterized protein n=1 Tax=Bemisia tabaci TaxID=7038 RepID=UPI003B282E77